MLKVAVIGAGTMGSVHATAYSKMSSTELVGIVDPRREHTAKLASSLGTKSYDTLENLLEANDPDVVDVCVPTYLHRTYVERLARLKKHVICEKPISRTLEDARAMIDTCNKEGVDLYIAQVVRFFPEYKRAHDLLLDGAVGETGTVYAMRGGVFPQGWQDWYANFDRCGTLIVDMMIHDFDFLRWCYGDIERVFAKSMWGRDFQRLDHAMVSLRFKSGVIALCEGTWAHTDGFRTRLEISGKEGIISHDSEEAVAIRSSFRTRSSEAAGVAVPESPLNHDPYYLELEHFIDCIEHGKPPIVSAEDGYQALEISLAALESIQTGNPVEW